MAVSAPPSAECLLLRLPNELVLDIIRLVCDSGPRSYYLNTPYRSVQDIRTLAHTCPLFRQLIKGGANGKEPHPSIMQDLPLLCDKQWVDAAAGSGTLPLTVRATYPEPDARTTCTLVRALSLISRIGALILRGDEEEEDQPDLLYRHHHCRECQAVATAHNTICSAPALTTLRLTHLNADTLFWNDGQTPELPNLEILQLHKCWISQDSPWFRSASLTVLELAWVSIMFDDDESLEAFVDMLRPCSATLRELIIYHYHLFCVVPEPESIDPAGLQPSFQVVDFLALEKISLRIHVYVMAHLLIHFNAPHLRIAHVAPVLGDELIDSQLLCNTILPRLADSLLGGGGVFNCIMVDRTRQNESMRVVATTDDNRVLEMSLLTGFSRGSGGIDRFDLHILDDIFPECMRRAAAVHLVADLVARNHDYLIPECDFALSYLFPSVVELALYGPCAEHMIGTLAWSCRRAEDLAPALKNVTILWSPRGGPEDDARVSSVVANAEHIMKHRKIRVNYDTVLAPRTGAAGFGRVYAETKEQMRRISGVVRKEWKEFAHSFVAEELVENFVFFRT